MSEAKKCKSCIYHVASVQSQNMQHYPALYSSTGARRLSKSRAMLSTTEKGDMQSLYACPQHKEGFYPKAMDTSGARISSQVLSLLLPPLPPSSSSVSSVLSLPASMFQQLPESSVESTFDSFKSWNPRPLVLSYGAIFSCTVDCFLFECDLFAYKTSL